MHLLTALIGLSTVAAQISRVCPTSDSKLCYSLNIPSVTAQSGNGDIFLQIQAPANTYQWIALGQGSNMRGSHFMILYLSSDGKNVTVSPRVGTGHVQPQNDASTTQSSGISVLEGSSISNGLITANFRCSGCTSWSGGSMDFTSGSGGWNFAYKAGTPIQSNDLNAGIQRHDDHGEFNWDFSAAKGTTASANPFVTSSTSTTGSNTGSGNNTTTTTTQVGTTVTSGSTSNSIIIAHAVFACLTVALVLPIGGIIIRLMSFPGLLWVHSTIQLLGTAMFITAFGLGAYYATKNDYWMSSHAIIGTVVLALMLCQPILGVIHHKMYVREQRRGAFSYAHIGIGRIVVFLGIINGGLGLELAGQSVGAKAGYGAGAGLMGLIYLAAIIIGERKRSRTKLSSDASSSRSDIARAEQQQYHVTK